MIDKIDLVVSIKDIFNKEGILKKIIINQYIYIYKAQSL